MSAVDSRPSATWIAAYAMGVAAAGRQVDGCLHELAAMADNDPSPLEDARRRLQGLEVGDPELCVQADELLAAAAARVRRAD